MTCTDYTKETLNRWLSKGNERANFEAMREYVNNGGEVYTFDEIRKLSPSEVGENFEKVHHSLTYIVYKELL